MLWTGGAMAFVLVAAAGGGYLYIRHLNGNITSVSDDGASTGGFQTDKAINILLIGTDKRTGAGNRATATRTASGTRTPRSCCTSRRTVRTRPR